MNNNLKQFTCIFCNAGFECPDISNDADLKDFENCDMDCPECGKTMLIKDGELKDMNAILIENYRKSGIKIENGTDVIHGEGFGFIQIPIHRENLPKEEFN